MKVIFFTTNLDSGGIENYLLRYLHYNSQITSIVITKSGKHGVLFNNYKKLSNVKIVSRRLKYISIFDFLWLIKLYKNEKPQTVCDFTGDFAFSTLIAAKIAGVSNRIAFYRSSKNFYKPSILRDLISKIFRLITSYSSSKILLNSRSAKDYFFSNNYQINRKKIVIHNGIQIELYKNDEKIRFNKRFELGVDINTVLVGHIGRFDLVKNQKIIIELSKRFRNRDVKFVLCGQGVESAYKAKVLEENLPIILLPFSSEIPKLLSAFDIFIFPSLSEGQPNALLEAFASGLPAICSDIPSIREITPDSFHSLLIKNIENVDEYEVALVNLINSPNRREEYKLKDYIIKNFDHRKNFKLFTEQLFTK